MSEADEIKRRPRGAGSIEEVGGRFRFRCPVGGGRRFTSSLAWGSAAEAQAALDAYKATSVPDTERIRADRFAASGAGFVYFIQSSRGGPIKIGTAGSVRSRLSDLQGAHAYPLIVLARTGGGRRKEHHIHKRFREHRLEGEWFEPTTDLLNFIAELVLAQDVDSGHRTKVNIDRLEALVSQLRARLPRGTA